MGKTKKVRYIYRSSITGKIVKKQYALENPDTTTKETIIDKEEENRNEKHDKSRV